MTRFVENINKIAKQRLKKPINWQSVLLNVLILTIIAVFVVFLIKQNF